MKKLLMVSLCMIGLNAYADMDIAKKNNCLACHAAEYKLIGPSFKDIKAKYKNDKTALNKLMTKVKNGGSGNWG